MCRKSCNTTATNILFIMSFYMFYVSWYRKRQSGSEYTMFVGFHKLYNRHIGYLNFILSLKISETGESACLLFIFYY